MTLWTKETITGDLRDLPAGVQEIPHPGGRTLPAAAARERRTGPVGGDPAL